MTTIYSKKRIGIFLIVLVLICGIASIITTSVGNNDLKIQQISSLLTSRSYPTTEELSVMVSTAEVVVLGEYVGFDSHWNMARSPDNIFEKDNEYYSEGHLYSFTVDNVLKGALSDSVVLINHRYSELKKVTESNAIVNSEGIIVVAATKTNDISFALIDALYIAPEVGAKYILFLTKDNTFGNYYGSIEPFAIKMIDNIAYVQSNQMNSTGSKEQTITIDGTSRTIVVTEHFAPLNDKISGTDFNLLMSDIIDMSANFGR
jgi:hypothetical protein